MAKEDIIEIAGKRLLRLSTFAEDMGLHIRTVQLWARDHDMPVIRVGNQMLLDLDDIPDWLDRNKSKPAAYAPAEAAPSGQACPQAGQTAASHQA
jgi:excisionase family DNA binding protein